MASTRTGSNSPAAVAARKKVVERGSGPRLGIVEQVGIGIERDLRACVPQSLLHDLHRLTGLEQQ